MRTFTFSDLCRKEVVCLCDGARLGYIEGFEADADSFCIIAFFIPAGKSLPFKKKTWYRIDRCDIEKIGEDLILVRRYGTVGGGCGCDRDQ